MIRHDDVTGTGESRSELLIQQTNAHDNGTYYCQAENKAARSVSNFTLHVTNSVDSPTILQVYDKKRAQMNFDIIIWEIQFLEFMDPIPVSICTRIMKYRVWTIKFDELEFLSSLN